MALAYFYPEWRNIETLLIFWLMGSLIALVFYMVQFDWIKNDNMAHTNPFCKKVLKIIKESKIVYANGIFTALSTYADRYIITAFLGLELTGVYIFFWQISSALSNLLYTGVIQLYRPKLVRAFGEKNPIYNTLFKTCLKKSVFLATMFAIITGVTLYMCLPYLHKPLVEAHFILTYWILTGFILSIIIEVMNLILYSSHNDVISLKIRIINFINVIILNAIFIHFYNLDGAGMALLFSLFFQVTLIHFYLKKYHLYHVSYS
jgi:O-antigen/teichoic acid export membrane protein